jgi:ABC-2 type transport system permease protein
MNRIFVVARHEYLTNVRRWEFLLLTFGFPFIGLLIGVLAIIPTMFLLGKMPQEVRVGVVDETKRFTFPKEIEPLRIELPKKIGKAATAFPGFQFRSFPDADKARAALQTKTLDAFLVVPRDYVKRGIVHYYVWQEKEESLFDEGERKEPPLEGILVKGLLKGKVTDEVVQRVLEPYRLERHTVGPHKPKKKNAFISQFVIPYAFTMMLVMAIFISSGYLLRGVSDEKEGRVAEIILSSVTAQDLFVGKVLGLGAVGLTQVGVWMMMGGTPMLFTTFIADFPVRALVAAPILFLLGYTLFGVLFAALGAVGGSWRESQQLSAWISMLAIVPLIFMPILLDQPNGGFSISLSLFPFTAPITVMMRLALTDVPLYQILLSIVSMVITIVLIVKLCVKIFRTGMLIYGKRPGVKELWRWVREA